MSTEKIEVEKIATDRYRLRFREHLMTVDAQGLLDLMDYGLRYARTLEQESEARNAACRCAQEQAAHDLPYAFVGEARLFQYHETSDRWYIEVDVKHHDPDQGAAVVLYRVWHSPGGLAAFKVDIRESE
jgi:hypothetical protein